MLMLTHTYILQNLLGKIGARNFNSDIFVYNIMPDLLTIHPDINSEQTHKIERFLQIPSHYPQAAYIMFHLLIDDLAHYGKISSGLPDAFNPNSRGYCYIKGKPLINSILDFQKNIGKDISCDEAAYRSHLIVEMTYDLVIIEHINKNQTMELLTDAICNTAKGNMDEFLHTINWLYGLDKEKIHEVMLKAHSYMTFEKISKTMSIEGRTRLYAYRFGLPDDQLNFAGIKKIFLQARELLNDGEIFLTETSEAIKEYGWLPPVR
jgi:hypothetical protein